MQCINFLRYKIYYNYNPWKVDYLFTPSYKAQREKNLSTILIIIDYRDEISDDENSVINCEKVYDLLSNLNKVKKDISKEFGIKMDDSSANLINEKGNHQEQININNTTNNDCNINNSYNNLVSNQFIK